jgi:hypothetical protein
MENNKSGKGKKIDPERMKVLRNLPLELKQSLTKEEVDCFLFENEWPDSLMEKLRDYIAED